MLISIFFFYSFLISIPPSASADVSAVKSEAWENLKAKNIDFYHSIRLVNEYGKYIWPKYIFWRPPPPQKKGILKNIIVFFEYLPERVQYGKILGLGPSWLL